MYAVVEHQGANQQFAVLQTPAKYEGTKFTLLIDSGSTHSFISPRCIRNLNLHEHLDVPLTVELATGKRTRIQLLLWGVSISNWEKPRREEILEYLTWEFTMEFLEWIG